MELPWYSHCRPLAPGTICDQMYACLPNAGRSFCLVDGNHEPTTTRASSRPPTHRHLLSAPRRRRSKLSTAAWTTLIAPFYISSIASTLDYGSVNQSPRIDQSTYSTQRLCATDGAMTTQAIYRLRHYIKGIVNALYIPPSSPRRRSRLSGFLQVRSYFSWPALTHSPWHLSATQRLTNPPVLLDVKQRRELVIQKLPTVLGIVSTPLPRTPTPKPT